MKSLIRPVPILLVLLSTFSLQPSTAFAQGTAFTYQGQLQYNGGPASGLYDFQFSLSNAPSGGIQVGSTLTVSAVGVTNGLFITTLNFGPVFTGNALWLAVSVRTNSVGSYIGLKPLQQLTPTPYAIFANTSSNLSGTVNAAQLNGTVGNNQLANSSITVNAGTGLNGGGAVTLGGSTTLNNAGVLSVSGNADITASTVSGAVTLGDTATSANTASTIVKRDGSGNFSAGTVTLSGNLDLPATTATAGIIYSGSSTLVDIYGNQNFYAGLRAGNLTMTGTANTGVGWQAFFSNTSGSQNTAIGVAALEFNTTGNNNTANGNAALEFNGIGTANTASGYQALRNNTTGTNNSANGVNALYMNATGYENTGNGVAALYSNTNGYDNTVNGFEALYSSPSSTNNTAEGAYALYADTAGFNNTANGAYALYNNTNGWENTAVGYQALYHNTSGTGNTAEGAYALWWNTSGLDNTANGDSALNSNTTGFENTADGLAALHQNTTGMENTAIGVDALDQSISGSDNIALGFQAGNVLQTGNGNIYIGNSGTPLENYTIRIGTQNTHTNTFIAGIYGETAASGVAVYVNSSGELGTLTSSRRFKDDIRGMDQASDVIYALKPVTFKYKPGIDPQGIPQFGLVAEDVEKVAPDLVAHDDQGKIYTVRYQAVDAMLLNEFLKEHHTVEEQNTKLRELDQKVDAENSENAELKQRLATLEKIVLKQKSN